MTVLLFSGGRDSTLAAVELSKMNEPLILVTVTNDQLYGIESVRQRIAELIRYLPKNTRWLLVKEPSLTQNQCTELTHLRFAWACIISATQVAREFGHNSIACGYTSYQSEWNEQKNISTQILKDLLGALNLNFLLPVRELVSKDAAIDRLKALELSTVSLEQKSDSRNANLENASLEAELKHAQACFQAIFRSNDRQKIQVVEDRLLVPS